MTITPSLFEAFLKCPTKCWLRATSETPSGNPYAEWVQSQNESFRATATERLLAATPPGESARSPAPEDLKAAKWRLAVEVVARASALALPALSPARSGGEGGRRPGEGEKLETTAPPPDSAPRTPPAALESRLHAVERVPAEGRGQAAQFVPIRFIFRNKLTADDRLLLAFDALVLAQALGRDISLGKIIHGDDHATLTVKLGARTAKSARTPAKPSGLLGDVRKRLEKIAALLSSPANPRSEESLARAPQATDETRGLGGPRSAPPPPDLVLNRHCSECEFQARCRKLAIEKDDLSLLAGMNAKERQKLRSKGIFTVTQLSYTFRPRRRPKQLRDKREKYHHSLKALAIREKKIHIVGSPELKIEGTPVYLDVEGLPDRDFYYLIGLRIGNGETAVQHSLWADTVADEGKNWREFLGILENVEKPVLIHYGSYETTSLKRMRERYGGPPEDSPAAKALASAVNLLSVIFAHFYFPTFSNGLKDIAGWLGYKWSGSNPSGIQSIIWRTKWQEAGEPSVKQSLVIYNSEDCQSLQLVTEVLFRRCSPDPLPDLEKGADPPAVIAERSSSKERLWRRFTTPIEVFEVINKAARWDFQRDRVYIRTNKTLKRIASEKNSRAKKNKARLKRTLLVNKTVTCEPIQACPFCGSKPEKEFRPRSLTLNDLRFSNYGLKRWVVKYRFHYYRCSSCQKRFGRPREFWPRSEFGRNTVAFVIYDIIELCVPQMTTTESISRLFGLRIGYSTVNDFKASAADYYAGTRQRILAHMIEGNLVHADETTIALKDRSGYVWIFTSLQAVVYFYADTREGDVLREKLTGFKGVLVSDFYAAYDSLACPQQKCLLHLMRDLNEALLAVPFDEQLKQIALGFGVLLKGVAETIDRWGLKRRFLKKHLAGVDRFYRQLAKADYQSEAALKFKDRFEKNRPKLFTFLSFDGIPWNNNNAEHAIKAFARLRRAIEGLSTPKGIEDYLVLLSICQTCKYMGVDFLDFLRSGEKDIHAFAESRRGRRRRTPANEPKPLPPEASAVAIPDAGNPS